MSHQTFDARPGVPIKAWTDGVPVEDLAMAQLRDVAQLPVVHPHVAAMPDVQVGWGATVGSVIPTRDAIIPAAVGVDLGCGMMACRTSLTASQLPDNLARIRSAMEAAVPHGRTSNGGRHDKGAWRDLPDAVADAWSTLEPEFEALCDRHGALRKSNNAVHLGTLGTGNHFIELCLDEDGLVWVMLHSGSRGVGNRIGSYFIGKARDEMRKLDAQLPHRDLAYLREGTQSFDDYVAAVGWAQRYARLNRELMMAAVVRALRRSNLVPREFDAAVVAVNCRLPRMQQKIPSVAFWVGHGPRLLPVPGRGSLAKTGPRRFLARLQAILEVDDDGLAKAVEKRPARAERLPRGRGRGVGEARYQLPEPGICAAYQPRERPAPLAGPDQGVGPAGEQETGGDVAPYIEAARHPLYSAQRLDVDRACVRGSSLGRPAAHVAPRAGAWPRCPPSREPDPSASESQAAAASVTGPTRRPARSARLRRAPGGPEAMPHLVHRRRPRSELRYPSQSATRLRRAADGLGRGSRRSEERRR
jgi:hypothetical protein